MYVDGPLKMENFDAKSSTPWIVKLFQFISEAHLHKEKELHITEYKWIGYDRLPIHVNAPTASVGVETLVKNWWIDLFSIYVIDKSYDGILGIKFTKHNSDFEFVVLVCYVPPARKF